VVVSRTWFHESLRDRPDDWRPCPNRREIIGGDCGAQALRCADLNDAGKGTQAATSSNIGAALPIMEIAHWVPLLLAISKSRIGDGASSSLSRALPNSCFPPRESSPLGLAVEDGANHAEAAFPKKRDSQVLAARAARGGSFLARSRPGVDLKRVGLGRTRRSVALAHLEKGDVSIQGIAFAGEPRAGQLV
jgi:hypothetical protein